MTREEELIGGWIPRLHYDDVTMSLMASQITSLTIVYSTVYSGTDQRKHQSPASLAFVWRIHRAPVNSPHKWPVTRKMLPFDDVIMGIHTTVSHIIDTSNKHKNAFALTSLTSDGTAKHPHMFFKDSGANGCATDNGLSASFSTLTL